MWEAEGFPCEFYALGGIGPGIPLRATVTSFGPALLSKVLELDQGPWSPSLSRTPERPRSKGSGFRRGAPALRRGLQGRRHLLRHADAPRRAGGGAGASSGTGCSTRCALLPRTMRRRCGRR
ncbi:helicase HerA-like domain-containing protein [Streptomyces sp. NPDC102437]|uniref:helicase HerA-like domain-containing protein n=1 Tax=Streptomyces sp. NPDC102437 TaxID=3366175 RepID=UPI0038260333